MDRIQLNSILIVLCFVSVLLLESQSAASYPTYFLLLSALVSFRLWDDVFSVPLVWLVLLLLVHLGLSSLWSDPMELREVASTWVRALLVFAFVVMFAECHMRGHVRRWLGRGMAGVGLAAALAAVIVFHIESPADGRLNGLGQLDTHVMAALIFGVVLIFLLDLAMTDGSRAMRYFVVASIPVVVYAIVMSDSRNAWVSVVLGVGTYLLARHVRGAGRFLGVTAVLALTLAVALGVMLLNDDLRAILLPRGDSFRPEIWGEIFSRWVANGLWFGLGINTPDSVFVGGIEFLHPHNLYLAVAYQGGIVALVLFAALLSRMIHTLLREYEHDDAKLALGILGLALPAYLLDGHELIDKVGSTWFLLWFPVAVALGLEWRRSLQAH